MVQTKRVVPGCCGKCTKTVLLPVGEVLARLRLAHWQVDLEIAADVVFTTPAA